MMFNPANFINPLNNLGAVDNAALAQGLSGGNYSLASIPASTSIDKLTKQILGQGLTSKWSGQGHGSPEANARDMARIMFDAGITDIKQFGKVPKYEAVQQAGFTLNGQRVSDETDWETGVPTGRKIVTFPTGQKNEDGGDIYTSREVSPEELKKLQPVYVKNAGTDPEGYAITAPVDPSEIVNVNGVPSIKTGTTFGNKDTGQTFARTYDSDPTAWGGTYAGKGNTGYRVHFTDDGTPYFYTTGASSSDLGRIAPFLAIAQFIPGVAPFAAAANAAIAIDQGNVLGGLASLAGIPGVSEAAKVAGLGSAVSGIQTANQINNIVKAAESGNVLGALTAGANVAGMGGVQLGDTGLTVSDVLKTANAIDALDKGNFGSLISTLAPSGGLSGPKSSDFEEGYFRPGGAGYDDPDNIDAGGGWNPANVIPQFPQFPTVPTFEQQQPSIDELLKSLAPFERPAPLAAAPEIPTVPTFEQQQPSIDAFLNELAPYAPPLADVPEMVVTESRPDMTPDNIDVGGGWNPAGLPSFDDVPEMVVTAPRPDTTPDNIDAGGGWNPADVPDRTPDNIDAGGGWNPATGGGGAPTPPSKPAAPPARPPAQSPAAQPAAQYSPGKEFSWLDTSPQMLRNAPVTNQNPIQLTQLQQMYQGLAPEMQSVFASRGINAPIGYAKGGSTKCNLWGDFSEYMPKFERSAPTMLQNAGGRRQALALNPLKHIMSAISPQGNIGGLAQGGLPTKYKEAAPEGHKPEFVTGLTGYYAGGRGTGQSDDIPAMLHDGDYVIDAEAVSALGDGSSKAGKDVLTGFLREVPHRDGAQGKPVPAKIADGEFVFPEAFVTALGNGDNKRGAKMLDMMRENLRAHKRSAPTSKIPPKALSPLDYLKKAKG